MLDAIAEKAAREECRGEFLDTATQRLAEIAATGKAVPWSEMRRYLERKVKGKKIPRPKPRTITRQ